MDALLGSLAKGPVEAVFRSLVKEPLSEEEDVEGSFVDLKASLRRAKTDAKADGKVGKADGKDCRADGLVGKAEAPRAREAKARDESESDESAADDVESEEEEEEYGGEFEVEPPIESPAPKARDPNRR